MGTRLIRPLVGLAPRMLKYHLGCKQQAPELLSWLSPSFQLASRSYSTSSNLIAFPHHGLFSGGRGKALRNRPC